MESVTANEAKTHFGDLLLKVQTEPVQIERHGKVVAVVLSRENYAFFETLKMEQLKNRIVSARNDIASGHMMDGDEFFDTVVQPA